MKHDKYPSRQGYWDDPWERQPQRLTKEHAPQPEQNQEPGRPAYTAPPEDTPLPQPKKRKRRPVRFLVGVLVAALLVGIGAGAAETFLQQRTDTVYEERLPEDEEVTESTESVPTGQCYLEQAELTDQVTMTLMSQADLEQLSYEEIYAANIGSVVSLRCYLIDGSGCTGTGIILSSDGYLVTNEHVIEDAEECVVVLQDDRTYQAKLVGLDEETDLAVLKIEAKGLTPAVFGDSEEMVVGNSCVAIGNPLGETFRGTMTTGIISALNRNVSVNGHYMTLIQTDCAINSGNSGGPLINLYGQVIGICNMKMMSTSTTVEGLGFAIPTATVKTVVNKLLSQGEVIRAMLGITAYNLDGDECRSYGIEGGIMVVQVSAQSDAYAKGIRNGDIVIAANGIPISSVNQLNTYKADMSPGDVLVLTILRDGEQMDVDVVLMEQSVVE
jgi:serine protease Do